MHVYDFRPEHIKLVIGYNSKVLTLQKVDNVDIICIKLFAFVTKIYNIFALFYLIYL